MKFSKPLENVGQGIYGWATLLMRWMYLTASPKARLTVTSNANPTLEIQVVDSLTETPLKGIYLVRLICTTTGGSTKDFPPRATTLGDWLYSNNLGGGNDNKLNPIIETNENGRILINFKTPPSKTRVRAVVLGHVTSIHISVRS